MADFLLTRPPPYVIGLLLGFTIVVLRRLHVRALLTGTPVQAATSWTS